MVVGPCAVPFRRRQQAICTHSRRRDINVQYTPFYRVVGHFLLSTGVSIMLRLHDEAAGWCERGISHGGACAVE